MEASQSSSQASDLSHQESTAARAQRHTAQLAALLSTQSGKALVQHQLAAAPAGNTVCAAALKAQCQTAKLAALTSTEQGRAMLQTVLGHCIERRQARQMEQHEAAGSAPSSPAAAASSKRMRMDLEVPAAADAGGQALLNLHPKVLATAVAVARTPVGSAERAAGVAMLKQELMTHSSLSMALALASCPSETAAELTAAVAEPASIEAALQELKQSPASPVVGPRSSSACGSMLAPTACTYQPCLSPGQLSPTITSTGNDNDGTSCPLPQALLQSIQQQVADEHTLTAAAIAAGVYAAAGSSGGSACRSQSLHGAALLSAGPSRTISNMGASLRCASLDQAQGANSMQGAPLSRTTSQMQVFKRRSATSTALRRHFNAVGLQQQSQAATAAAGSKAANDNARLHKPQQLFKKQRKRPLVLWSSNSSTQQQLQAFKAPLQNQAAAEPACSYQTSSSGMAASAFNSSRGTAAAATAAAAPTGVDSVLSTLVRQEQQLLLLQQQLRQHRQLISERRQQQAAAAAVDEEMEDVVHPGALPPATLPHTQALPAPQVAQQQIQQDAVAPAEAITALLAIANALAAQQDQQQAAQTAAGNSALNWGDDVVKKLTAALMAA